MSWNRLIEIDGETALSHGAVVRVLTGKWPYEDVFDLLLIEDSQSPSNYSFLVATGYKAGLLLIRLPQEALSGGGLSGLWVKENWNKWIYQDCASDNVLYTRDYHIRGDGLIGPHPSKEELVINDDLEMLEKYRA